jgi:hypothetical protein
MSKFSDGLSSTALDNSIVDFITVVLITQMSTDRKISNTTILKLNTIKNPLSPLCFSFSIAAFSDNNQDIEVLNSVLYFIKYGYIQNTKIHLDNGTDQMSSHG